MKKTLLIMLILILVQAACNLPQTAPLSPTPGLPPVTVATANPPVSTASATNTDLPLAPAITSTADATQPLAPTSTETLSPITTLTETPDPNKLFSSVNLSAQVISPKCEPKSVRIEVVADPKVYSVVLFTRLQYKTVGERTKWTDGVAMRPISGKFVYDLKASSILDFNQHKDPVAWVQFQLVATDSTGAIIGRSEVFTDKLTLSATCP